MKILQITTFLFFCAFISSNAQISSEFKSVISGDPTFLRTAEIDKDGNIYIVFEGTTPLDVGMEEEEIIDIDADRDLFVIKYNHNKEYQWHIHIERVGLIGAITGLSVDDSGNIYLSGFYSGIMEMTTDGQNQYQANGSDDFIAKYDANKEFLWLNVIDGDIDIKQLDVVDNRLKTSMRLLGNADIDPSEEEETVSCYLPYIGCQTQYILVDYSLDGEYIEHYVTDYKMEVNEVVYEQDGSSHILGQIHSGANISFYNSVTPFGTGAMPFIGSYDGDRNLLDYTFLESQGYTASVITGSLTAEGDLYVLAHLGAIEIDGDYFQSEIVLLKYSAELELLKYEGIGDSYYPHYRNSIVIDESKKVWVVSTNTEDVLGNPTEEEVRTLNVFDSDLAIIAAENIDLGHYNAGFLLKSINESALYINEQKDDGKMFFGSETITSVDGNHLITLEELLLEPVSTIENDESEILYQTLVIDNLTIKSSDSKVIKSISIYSIMGAFVRTSIVNASQIIMNIQDYDPGTYIAEVFFEDGTKRSYQFIKI